MCAGAGAAAVHAICLRGPNTISVSIDSTTPGRFFESPLVSFFPSQTAAPGNRRVVSSLHSEYITTNR
ncbi:hypothetical protein HBI56_224060 [Parastagonospora nodorum]|nr:hypothetical protein HBH52_065650 [Parastagonospora nodorum]KAH3985670.1 hypothetical protein HBH51_024430 [Parastagonospora nodorum]KAH4003318.1 hypothetical protein HBI10_063600 [Parastagonospora nodorum]KAH4078008.1 hypothetical protein HBH46_239130 [Parastagonospora nodorum]KAH4128871.1 hypothetical protein HBH47_036930 [Parastagonospora nodorum]